METILEKTYYLPTFIDNSKTSLGQKTGDYSGYLLTRTFRIRRGKKIYLNKEFGVIQFGGKNKKEMIDELMRAIKGKKELPKIADGDKDFIPTEVRSLIKRNRKIPLKIG